MCASVHTLECNPPPGKGWQKWRDHHPGPFTGLTCFCCRTKRLTACSSLCESHVNSSSCAERDESGSALRRWDMDRQAQTLSQEGVTNIRAARVPIQRVSHSCLSHRSFSSGHHLQMQFLQQTRRLHTDGEQSSDLPGKNCSSVKTDLNEINIRCGLSTKPRAAYRIRIRFALIKDSSLISVPILASPLTLKLHSGAEPNSDKEFSLLSTSSFRALSLAVVNNPAAFCRWLLLFRFSKIIPDHCDTFNTGFPAVLPCFLLKSVNKDKQSISELKCPGL